MSFVIDESVTRVLPKLLVGLDRKNPRCRVPDDWLTPITRGCAGFPSVRCRVDVRVPELDEERIVAVTLVGSMSPSNGIVTRGCRLKPSSTLMSVRSWQSDTRTAQSGSGSLMRSPVFCASSATVNISFGKTPLSGVSRPNRTWTVPLLVSGDEFWAAELPGRAPISFDNGLVLFAMVTSSVVCAGETPPNKCGREHKMANRRPTNIKCLANLM